MLALFLIAASGLGSANAHADTGFPKPIHFPSTRQVANRLGETLAIDPRVTYPPDSVQCWFPAKDTFTMQCDAQRRAKSKHWHSIYDVLYGVRVKVFEDNSWTITKYLPIAMWSETGRRF